MTGKTDRAVANALTTDEEAAPLVLSQQANEGLGHEATADEAPKGNGHINGRASPFADVDADDSRWRDDLPTEVEAKLKPTSVYSPESLHALVKLREDNMEDYVDLVAVLAAAANDPAVTRAKIDAAVKDRDRKEQQDEKASADGDDEDHSPSVADQLVRQVVELVAAQQVILGHTDDGTGYARCPAGNGILTTHRIDGTHFRSWLRRRHYTDTKKSLRADALSQAVSTIAAIAETDGEQIDRLFVRVGAHDGKHYLDLGTPDWSAIEIGPGLGTNSCGWQLVSTPPVWFVRSATMRPLPMPVAGGSIDELRPFLNVSSNDDNNADDGFVLSVGHCLGSLNPDGPFGILLGVGPWNAAKSTWLSVLRRLVDPNHADRRAPPATVLDLLRNAQRTWSQSFDNVTSFTQEMCDAFCRMSTGGGDVVRKLFTDDGEMIFESRRPIIMTSTLDAITRPDMLNRTLIVPLSFIEKDKMKTEKRFWEEYEAAQPRILGALLTAVAHGLAQPPVERTDLPRLADFADWVTRCEGGLGWEPDTFLTAFRNNAANSAQDALDNDPLATALRRTLQREPTQPDGSTIWEGLVSELQEKLRSEMGDYAFRAANLPRLPHHFSGRLRQVAPLLSRVGINLTRQHTEKGSAVFLGMIAQRTQRETPTPRARRAKSASGASGASSSAKSAGLSTDAHSIEAPPSVLPSVSRPRKGASAKPRSPDAQGHPSKPQKTNKNDAPDADLAILGARKSKSASVCVGEEQSPAAGDARDTGPASPGAKPGDRGRVVVRI